MARGDFVVVDRETRLIVRMPFEFEKLTDAIMPYFDSAHRLPASSIQCTASKLAWSGWGQGGVRDARVLSSEKLCDLKRLRRPKKKPRAGVAADARADDDGALEAVLEDGEIDGIDLEVALEALLEEELGFADLYSAMAEEVGTHLAQATHLPRWEFGGYFSFYLHYILHDDIFVIFDLLLNIFHDDNTHRMLKEINK